MELADRVAVADRYLIWFFFLGHKAEKAQKWTQVQENRIVTNFHPSEKQMGGTHYYSLCHRNMDPHDVCVEGMNGTAYFETKGYFFCVEEGVLPPKMTLKRETRAIDGGGKALI